MARISTIDAAQRFRVLFLEPIMTTSHLTIPYPDDLLLSLKLTPERFEAEARMLLAIKLYEQGRVTTGIAAQVAGIDRVTFMFELDK
jgi:hypothetical protein